MKIFITGITGLLGRHTAQLCAEEGHEIIALVRNKDIKPSSFNHPLQLCYGDITQVATLGGCISGSDIIIHCAADTSLQTRKNALQDEINIAGIKNLIEASKKAGIKKFIHISSATTIASGNVLNPADESKKLISSPERLPYINSKIAAEEILLNEFKNNQFPVIILNPTFILGPEDYKVNSGKLIMAAIKKQLLFYPSGEKNIVDARDIAQVILNACKQGRNGQNYLICNENLSFIEIFKIACKQANVATPKYRLPHWLGFIIGQAGSFIEFLTGKALPVNIKTIKISAETHYYNSDKAKNELGFNPRPAKQTIIDTVDWFINEQNRKTTN